MQNGTYTPEMVPRGLHMVSAIAVDSFSVFCVLCFLFYFVLCIKNVCDYYLASVNNIEG